MDAATLSGFADAAAGSQATFRVLMDALARPTLRQTLRSELAPPAPLSPNMAAIALTLLDFETSVWLDEALRHADVIAYLRFQTGVKIVDDPADAAFALVGAPAALPPLSVFAQGAADYPDRSTTLILNVAGIEPNGMVFTGPGIRGRASMRPVGLPDAFPLWLKDNALIFPLGVDLIFVTDAEIAALPRSSRLVEA